MRRRDFVRHTTAAGTLMAVGAPLPRDLSSRRVPPKGKIRLDTGWRFHRGDTEGARAFSFDDRSWDAAALPHAARIESLVTGDPGSDSFQWQGICWYRNSFPVQAEPSGRRFFLNFDGAMNVAEVWLNEESLGRHMGGWLPFGFDITDRVVPGRDNLLAVRLDNRDNPITGPKPLPQLDFNPYHGLYRSVHLVVKDALHITDPILADIPGGGGVFVTFPEVSAESATIRVQVHVRNSDDRAREFRLRARLDDDQKQAAAPEQLTEPVRLASGEDRTLTLELEASSPRLWSPRAPHLHELHTDLLEAGEVVDGESTRIGIRRIAISAEGFRINGERMFLRGTNRHQEYPYIGYALSDAAQYRDARKIKDAGFDYIRLSHYLHSPAFMDACDELGLVVMNCIPGWQFFNAEDPEFTEIQYDNCRRMIRRDRNHPCVILWEVSLNETQMPAEFIRQTQAIAKQEYPGDQCFTCGWTDGYDVFIQARQHGGCTEVTDRACVVSEYGDWEYYAQNAGLEQDAWADLAPDEANSRQLRWHGETALLQQATNFQEAHNDNRKTLAFADGLWVMFDYNRGYAPDIESSGCTDLFRVPKFSREFFRSQRPPDERLWQAESGPMVFIATHWTTDSSPIIRVFSNCEEIGLRLDGELLERRRPDRGRLCTHLAHPPFTFRLDGFQPGALEAIGYIGGTEAARQVVRTPGTVSRLDLTLDESGRPFAARARDVAFLRAALRDGVGTLAPDAWENVWFGATGDLALVGANPFSSEAGIASILVQSRSANPRGAVYALCLARAREQTRVLAAALSLGVPPEPFEVRTTIDGSDPANGAVRSVGSLISGNRVRAGLSVDGRKLLEADTELPKFRIAGSTAPEQREE